MSNIVLVGFMGSGKSTVGPMLAQRMRRPFVDLDAEIEADAGCSVSEIFGREGEAGFRQRESRVLRRVLSTEGRVVAVGGGAPMDDANWEWIRSGNCVVALVAEAAELAQRLNGATQRPLLGRDARAAIASILPGRMPRYAQADLVSKTDGLDPVAVAHGIAEQLPLGPLDRIRIDLPDAPHEVMVGTRLGGLVAQSLRRFGISGSVLVVTDAAVLEPHARLLADALQEAGMGSRLHVVPQGEAAKELGTLSTIYTALAQAGVDRGGALIALGGGAVGDVAGFAAATWMRGIRYLQVPTTLLAMVDSSIGGKTAVNLPEGKNLVGAVHQPRGIFCDLDYLETLPAPEYRAALAEIVKAALIADRTLFDWLSANLPALLRRELPIVREAVCRAVAIKASVVARDPCETGLRAILNYGHTVAHALEKAAGYGRLRHGEAVAWGMTVAAQLSALTGRCGDAAVEAQRTLLERCGLLDRIPNVAVADLVQAMQHDKKSRAGELRWVLLLDIGQVEYGQRVDQSDVEAALREVLHA
jgi:shikimate kinase/3-dehydroquinate synthase